MSILKKIAAILMCAVMVLSLIACGAKEDKTQAESNSSLVESNIDSGDSNIPVVETNSEDESTFVSETEGFAEENADETSNEPSLLSVTVYGPSKADVRRKLEKKVQSSVSVYFDRTPYSLLYADLGDGFFARLCSDSSILGTVDYEISDTEIVFHVDMSSDEDFSFDDVSSYTEIIDYDGNGGGKVSYDAKDVVERTNAEANDASAQSQSNEPFTIDSCAGTYLSTNGDTFTFESNSSSGSYSVKDFVLNGEAVEENLYPYFGNANFTEKDDGSIEVMTGVGGTNPNDGYIFLFKKDGTADVTQITMTMGPVGSAVTFNKQ